MERYLAKASILELLFSFILVNRSAIRHWWVFDDVHRSRRKLLLQPFLHRGCRVDLSVKLLPRIKHLFCAKITSEVRADWQTSYSDVASVAQTPLNFDFRWIFCTTCCTTSCETNPQPVVGAQLVEWLIYTTSQSSGVSTEFWLTTDWVHTDVEPSVADPMAWNTLYRPTETFAWSRSHFIRLLAIT